MKYENAVREISKKDTTIDELCGKVSYYDRQVETFKENVNHLTVDCENNQREKARLQEEIGKLQSEIAEFDSMLQKIVAENDQLNASLNEALTRITGLEGEMLLYLFFPAPSDSLLTHFL